jgi:membrane protein
VTAEYPRSRAVNDRLPRYIAAVGLTDRIDALQDRHPWLSFPIAVIYKFVDDQGGYLAALIAYYAFVSTFPLLLLASTVLSWVLVGDPELQRRVIDSALSQFPVIGDQLQQPAHLSGGVTGVLIGVLGALYGGLGIAVALQNAMNVAWNVPRNERPNPIAARLRGLVILAIVGGALLTATILPRFSGLLGITGTAAQIGVTVGTIAVNAVAFLIAFQWSTTRKVSLADIAPGAIGAAVGWYLIQSYGGTYVGHVMATASATNAVFALILGMLALFYITAILVVICVEVNVVRVDRLYPRAVLAVFTDNVELKEGDRRAYALQAEAQRNKDFQNVDVTFDEPDEREGIVEDPAESRT